VSERCPISRTSGITSDQTIRLTGTTAEQCPALLRRDGYRDPETGKHYVFLTNAFRLAAKTIAAIYKERWQIELFFKTDQAEPGDQTLDHRATSRHYRLSPMPASSTIGVPGALDDWFWTELNGMDSSSPKHKAFLNECLPALPVDCGTDCVPNPPYLDHRTA
jgi:hypothetical protein